MEAWQALLANAGLDPDAIYPETAALPETANAITLLIDGARVYVRRPDTPGAVLDVQPLIEALQLALASGEEAREHVTIYVAEDDYERERELLEGMREFTASLQLKLLPDGPLPLLAANIVQHAGVNLMPGPYQSKRKLNVSFAPWRYAAVLAGLFIAAHLGLKSWQYFHYRSQEARLDAQIGEVYQQLMPGAPLPDASSARRQVEARLNQLRGSGPVGGVMMMLAALGEAIGQTPDVTIENIAYVNNTTNLRVVAPSTDALDRIRQLASKHGLASELKSDNTRDSKHEGQLQFKNPGA
jgi:general secretion pathway protein L